MPLDGLVDLLHQANGLGEGDDDLLVVDDVVLGERAALAVLEPLLADLVATDVEVPHVLAHAPQAEGLGLVEPDGVLGPGDFLDLGVPAPCEFRDRLGELRRFQQVQRGEFATEPSQRVEQPQVSGQWQARKIDL